MANYTKKAILQTFEEMLIETPFDKITVTALVARCEISSNTFYYHYHDIFDLLDDWLDVKRQKYMSSEQTEDWELCLRTFLHAMQDNPQLVYHIFNSISRERLEMYIFSSIEDAFYDFAKRMSDGTGATDEVVRGVAGFCCYSLLGFLLKFIWNHMSADVDSSVDTLWRIFDGTIEYVVRKSVEQELESK